MFVKFIRGEWHRHLIVKVEQYNIIIQLQFENLLEREYKKELIYEKNIYVVNTKLKPNKYYMDKLENCLKKSRIPEQYHSIGQYAEEAVCIERKGRNWILYEGEKGKKHNVKQYNNWQKAYSEFFLELQKVMVRSKSCVV